MAKGMSRREMLRLAGMSIAGSMLAACAPAIKETVKETVEVEVPIKETVIVEGTPRVEERIVTAAPALQETLELVYMTPWVAPPRLDQMEEMVEDYNQTQGLEDNIHVTHSPVKWDVIPDKLTAMKIAGEKGFDVIHVHMSPISIVRNELVQPLPEEDAEYVKNNYIEGVVTPVTIDGRVWGYPCGSHGCVLGYRQSFLEKAGIAEYPKDTDELAEMAKELTQEVDGVKYYGYGRMWDNNWLSVDAEEYHWRFGGDLLTYEGDTPVDIHINTPEWAAAMRWLKDLVDAGVTCAGEEDGYDIFYRAENIIGRGEAYCFVNIRDQSHLDEAYEDYWCKAPPAAPGIDPVLRVASWMCSIDQGSPYPEQTIKYIRWIFRKPEMRYTRFRVEAGSTPDQTDYGTVPTWSEGINNGFVNEIPSLLRIRETRMLIGGDEIKEEIAASMQEILWGGMEIEPGIEALQAKVKSIFERTDAVA